MPVNILKAIQLGLEMVAAMPVHSLVYHLLQGIPVWIEVGLAIIAFGLLLAVASILRHGDRRKVERKPREVIVIEPSGNVTKVVIEEDDIVVVKPPAKTKKPKAAKTPAPQG